MLSYSNLQQEAWTCISDDSLKRRELIEAQLRYDVRILGAEALIVFSRTRCGARRVDQTTLGDHPPVLHLLGDQDSFDLGSCIHL